MQLGVVMAAPLVPSRLVGILSIAAPVLYARARAKICTPGRM